MKWIDIFCVDGDLFICVYTIFLKYQWILLIIEPESEIIFDYVYTFIVIQILKFWSL